MPLRLGRVRYINCEPVYYAIEHGLVPADCAVFDGTPAELNERLRAGDLDVSVVSAMEAALRPERYLLLPDLAIACDGPVESVLLASRMPIPELDRREVALTRHSLTSVYLVRLLLDKAYAVRPRFLAEGDAAAPVARLVIGDEALTQGPTSPYRLDLGEGWKAFTGLPFVFAVWAVRREAWASRAEEVRRLHAALLASKTATRDHPEAMVALARLRTGLPEAACRRYLSERLSFELTPRHIEGLTTFLRLLTDAGALPAQPWLEFIPS
ncbi:MAG: menaquinone biosynthetic enzyme MqnA/MqnD family protein [Candidatus Methylomirabilales bacterium]